VEARLYAEDPARDWQPQSGRLDRFEIPDVAARFSGLSASGIRVDAGFEAGNEVGTHYDAMLAKVICWSPTRDEALRRLAATLAGARIHGVRTNRDLLVDVLRHEAVLAGDLRTDLLERLDRTRRPGSAHAEAFAAAVAFTERARDGRAVQSRIPTGWRNVVSQPQRTVFRHDDVDVVAEWYGGRDGYRSADGTLTAEVADGLVVVREAGLRRSFAVFTYGDRVDVESAQGHVALTRVPRFADPADQVATGSLLAPMPGSVVRLEVEQGQAVTAGDAVLVLEAMKMQHTVTAPHDGVVTDLPVTLGTQVAAGAVLAVVTTEGDTP
jgi:propionyl-CoA carboxylase alpha chain